MTTLLSAAHTLESVLADRRVRTLFQPIVDLDTCAVVGFEALARGPVGSAVERADQLFGAARRAGRLGDLDVLCRSNALRVATQTGLAPNRTLFVNCEPDSLDGGDLTVDGLPFPVVLELTERDLARRPTRLLQAVSAARDAGWSIALDDVGAEPESLALLPLLRPDVIKLDLGLVQQQPSARIAMIVNAVTAEAERSGARLLAEGIETEEHRHIALGLGATLGQGWLFGRPEPAGTGMWTGTTGDVDGCYRLRLPDRPALSGGPAAAALSPYAIAAAHRPSRQARKSLLIEISKHLERQAIHSGESTVVLSTFQHRHQFTPATQRRYDRLQREACFVGVLAEGMAPVPLPGVRGAVLAPDDPVIGEWDIAVLGPHFAATLVARDLGDSGPEPDRRFEFVLSHDRQLTVDVAISLMSRIGGDEPAVVRPRDALA